MKKLIIVTIAALVLLATLLVSCNQVSETLPENNTTDSVYVPIQEKNLSILLTTKVYAVYYNAKEHAFKAYSFENELLDTFEIPDNATYDFYHYKNEVAGVIYIEKSDNSIIWHHVIFDGNHFIEVEEIQK